MQVRTGGTAGRTGVTENVALLHNCAVGNGEFGHVKKHGAEALAVIDADGVAEDVELFREDNFSVGDGANFFACRSSLIHATVKFTSRFAIVQAFHAKRRGDTAFDGRRKGIVPKTRIGNFISEIRQQLNFFGRRAERFDIGT